MKSKYINLLNFIPEKVLCGKNYTQYPISINSLEGTHIALSYLTNLHNQTGLCGKRKYSLIIPKYISRNTETFEVLGLLQAEMGKTNNGCIVFCNHEFQLMNKVIDWFENELNLTYDKWRWYIKVNINELEQGEFRKKLENKIINHWLNNVKINKEKAHPKTVTYIKNTKNKKLRDKDYGTLIIENKSNLLSQIIKKFVKLITENMSNFEKEEIRKFMSGIIAGESCVEIHKPSKKYRIHITANDKYERDIYQKCLEKLEISSKQYENYKDIIISCKENHLKLLNQNLMCLSPEKHDKFLYMLTLYKNLNIANYIKK